MRSSNDQEMLTKNVKKNKYFEYHFSIHFVLILIDPVRTDQSYGPSNDQEM
jgi:hypothetical protein